MRTLADIDGIGVGSTTDEQGLTGCTVVVFRGGAVCGVAERGVASGSRELAVISPRHSVGRAHAICLCGGSAYGLAAADGVMRELEAAGIGHETPAGRVPLVPAAVVYDLAL
ncbi:MAG: P1 family peptidase, partial [Myxococcales bacterium]|nr:P1 family peptidase [Myxococcales bacterium]